MRQAVAGVAAGLVVIVAVVVGWRTLEGGVAVGGDAGAAPAATVDAYLDAFATGDDEALVALVRDPPEALATYHEQLREGLGVTGLEVRRTDLLEDVDGRATATAEVTVEIAEVGPLAWEVELRLLRERGEWGVAWEPAALHPDWRPGLRFVTTTVTTERAAILAADGTTLEPGLADHVVGRTGEATAEELEELGPPYEPGDVIGRAGLERAFESQLAEGEEVRVELRDGLEGPVRSTLATADDDARGPLTTTLDVRVQRAIEATLGDRERPAAIVAVDAGSGAVRGVASRPLTGFDRALQGRYPAGTALAPVVIDAFLAAGGDAGAPLACPEEVVAGGRRLTNSPTRDGADDDGADGPDEDLELPLTEAAARGCATTLALIGADLGGEALADSAARFGAGRDPDLPLVSNGLSFPGPGDVGEAAVAAAGRGTVEVSPLHLATVGAAADVGAWWPPFLLEDDGPGDAVELDAAVSEATRALLASGGVGAAAGPIGFTATAPSFDGAVHRWFVGAVDGLGIAVLVEDDGEGELDDPLLLAEQFTEELEALDADPPA